MIHKFSINNINIVLDVNSGVVHLVDDIVYDILNYYDSNEKLEIDKEKENLNFKKCLIKLKDKYNDIQIKEAYDEIKKLQKNGLLFTDDIYEEIADKLDMPFVVKALCLHVAHDCNMRCKYCFASTGDFKGNRLLMPSQIGKKSIDFVIQNSGNRRNIEIDFFGGEPLMNFDVVKEIVEYAKDEGVKHNKNFRFTITTNGLLLNEEIKQYINNNMYNVVLSLDGRKETNDRMRVTINGKGSYDSIVDKFIDMANSRKQDNYYVRGTFTKNNLDFSKDVLHLADLSFKQISVEPVVTDEKEEYALREEDLPLIYKEYENLANEYIKRRKGDNKFNFFHFMMDLRQGPCAIKRLAGCGSGHEYLAITPEGDIYPCHQFVGEKDFRMGSVLTQEFDKDIMDIFKKSNIYTKPDCKKCWAKFYCSGGCSANAYQYNGNINKPYFLGCELQKKRIECALMIQAALSMDQENDNIK